MKTRISNLSKNHFIFSFSVRFIVVVVDFNIILSKKRNVSSR